MSPQLAALFAQHRTAILGGGAAAVAGLALLKRKKAGAAPAGATAGATVPTIAGTIPAAAVTTGSGAGYDSTGFDLYNSLQPELDQLAQAEQNRQTVGTSAAAAPAPVASTLFQPTYDGNYGRLPNGEGVEIESDGSLFHINDQAANKIAASGGKYSSLVQDIGWYSTTGNLSAVNSGKTPGPMTYDAQHNLVPWSAPTPTLPAKSS